MHKGRSAARSKIKASYNSSPIKVTRSEVDILKDLQNLCTTQGYIHALSVISARDNMMSFIGQLTPDDMAASYSRDRTIRTEFSTLLGFTLKAPIDLALPSPEQLNRMVLRSAELLEELHQCLQLPMMQSVIDSISKYRENPKAPPIDPFNTGAVLREPIFYGGDSAYGFQYLELAEERYGNDKDWLERTKKFTVDDARKVIEAACRLQVLKFTIRKNSKNFDKEASFLKEFTITPGEIENITNLSINVIIAVLESFTSPAPPCNISFVALGDFNLANSHPIIRIDTDTYIILQIYSLYESLYESPFYWMAADKDYRDIAFAHRGAFTEDFVAEKMARIFGPTNVHKNISIKRQKNSVSEFDILVLFGETAVVIQCKSKKLTIEARKGNDQHIRSDFSKSIQDSYDQAVLCSKFLIENDCVFIGEDGNALSIPNVRQVYPICVVSDHYPALAFQVRQFLNLESNGRILPPFVGDVFIIDTLAEFLSSPLYFLSYIKRRVLYSDKIVSPNEHSILGLHLRQNLWIDREIDQILFADDLAVDLDTAMTVRREGVPGSPTPQGILTKLNGTTVEKVIKLIEHRPDVGLSDFGFMLLTLSEHAILALNDGLDHVARQVRTDGLAHDFGMGLEEAKAGITIHCNRHPRQEALQRLAAHCQIRKYAARADSWFGLLVRESDGLPIVGITYNEPWQFDASLEAAAARMPRMNLSGPAFRSRPNRKWGRNEPCHCGSGKKYKRCCL